MGLNWFNALPTCANGFFASAPRERNPRTHNLADARSGRLVLAKAKLSSCFANLLAELTGAALSEILGFGHSCVRFDDCCFLYRRRNNFRCGGKHAKAPTFLWTRLQPSSSMGCLRVPEAIVWLDTGDRILQVIRNSPGFSVMPRRNRVGIRFKS